MSSGWPGGSSSDPSGGWDVGITKLSRADLKNPQEIAAAQTEILGSVYLEVVRQSRWSFWCALGGAVCGVAFFLAAIVIVLESTETDAAVLSTVAGAIIEAIAGLLFALYRMARRQLAMFHDRLSVTQRFLLANSMCTQLSGTLEDDVRSGLVRFMVGMPANGAVPT